MRFVGDSGREMLRTCEVQKALACNSDGLCARFRWARSLVPPVAPTYPSASPAAFLHRWVLGSGAAYPPSRSPPPLPPREPHDIRSADGRRIPAPTAWIQPTPRRHVAPSRLPRYTATPHPKTDELQDTTHEASAGALVSCSTFSD
ncbi:hypothetical protein VPH35_026973 [Triticum aestivum]